MSEKVGEEAFQILVIDKVLLRPIAPGAAGIGEATVEVARGFGAGSVDLAPVEAGALFRIGQKRIGGGNVLEACLGIRFPRIQVRVVLLRQLAVSLADVFIRS